MQRMKAMQTIPRMQKCESCGKFQHYKQCIDSKNAENDKSAKITENA